MTQHDHREGDQRHGGDEPHTGRDIIGELEHSFEVEDERWKRKAQVKDWLWLLLLLVAYAGFLLIVFATEPGLR